MKASFILFIFLAWGAWGAIPTAKPTTQLQKLSKALRGKPADSSEMQMIQGLKNEVEIDLFLKQKTNEYLQSKYFLVKMRYLIEELFRFQPQNPEIDRVENSGFGNSILLQSVDSYNNLVTDLINQNQSWDSLLLQNQFKAYVSNVYDEADAFETEKRFYEILAGNAGTVLNDLGKILERPRQSSIPLETLSFSFDDQDPRIAGILATPRFFSRYGNTALNKNRRRAAMIFRSFLCDSMTPVVPPANEENNKSDIDFVVGQDLTEDQIVAHTKVDLHGNQADCRSCHDKLDPMGQIFSGSNYQLNPRPAKGRLFYKRPGQSPVDIPVNGPRGLAKAIVDQNEYVKCQVQHFWNWFIGEDVPLTTVRQEELISKFNSVGRRPKDFIQILVKQPEFKLSPKPLTENQILARQALKILKTCNSCHVQQQDEMIYYWDVSSVPFGKTPKESQAAIEEIQKQLDVKNDGKNAKMPPKSSVWKPTEKEFQTLKKWLELGAPGLDGKSQLEAL